jgi:hypothetical protein
VITSGGTVARSSGSVSSVISGGTGVYNVTWNRAVDTCGYLASAMVISGDPVGGRFAQAENTAGAAVVTVRTFDSFGNAIASPFTLAVVC